MRPRIAILLLALAFLMTPGLVRKAQAIPPCSTSQCRSTCNAACGALVPASTCLTSSPQCNACGGVGVCSFTCTSGYSSSETCSCDTPPCGPPPGGSPIFRKQETKHSHPARPDAKPEGKPASAPESKPDTKAATKVEPKAETKSASESKSTS